jgi:hypothetical protein
VNRLIFLLLTLVVSPGVALADEQWNASAPRRVQQPVQEYFASTIPYSHVSARYGAMGPGEQEILWQDGAVCTQRLSAEWAGMWHLLSTPGSSADDGLDFLRCYPAWLEPRVQPRCLAVTVRAKGTGPLKIELKGPQDRLLGSNQGTLQHAEYREFRLPCTASELRNVRTLAWVLDAPARVCIDSLGLEIEYPDIPFSERVFLLSYAKLARCYNASLGTVRDKAHVPAGHQDCVPTSGMFTLATCAAWKLDMVSREFAVETLHRVHQQMKFLPKRHGLLPHFIRRDDRPEAAYEITPGSEFSSVDTALYYHSMLLAAQILEDVEVRDELLQAVKAIDFAALRNREGYVSHGELESSASPLPSVWADWGGETALVLLLQAIAEPHAAPRMARSGHVHEGVGFIAEIQSLFYPDFSRSRRDAVSGTNWMAARRELFRRQRAYFTAETSAGALGVFGVSAGEGPRGQGYLANGVEQSGIQIIHPHYMLLAWEHWPEPADLYNVLRQMEEQVFMPPWGLVENVDPQLAEYLPMNGSLNASFECLSAYHLWAKATGQPNAIYQAAEDFEPLQRAMKTFYP